MAKIEAGETVVVILQNPREKIFGVVHEVSAAGVFVRGVDLNYFDEWMKAIKNDEPYLPAQDYFFPMWRVERVSRDESSPEMPSVAEQFERQTGLNFEDF